ncbi:alkylated DNA repair protein AlkB [Aphanomyces invadans]|uniref:Alkylated DNA repair protein AlkB n=1 Tax=Aphanomyces invadans TaxID=157072 RepID=A0A024UCC3_9STRA|nr:alkylated DNA repair protein AlkB [Aphanomyces invadans]ETW03537.1 alkylated DNA repair protein AlkB [Aphanomyces invadans]|eukprot:XP_008867766.1 alkylated DNA repair protein AlkB [Aphanomyces invadans]
MNAYKAAEKKWKSFKVARGEAWEERVPHWSSDLIDLEASSAHGARQIDMIEVDPGRHRPVYSFCSHNGTDKTHEGFYVIPDALDHDTQRMLAVKCLTEYAEPPHTTNLHQLNQQVEQIWQKSLNCANAKTKDPMQSLHWAALGYHYDWTQRAYPDQAGSPIPEELGTLGTKFASAVGFELLSEAALVNYYKPTSTMGGHQDDVEVTFDHPVVSLSIGCSAIFLKGGLSKEIAPLELLVRSGDVVIMGGNSRLCFHGIAKILPVLHLDAFPLSEQRSPATPAVATFLRANRLNINVRQVFPHAATSDSDNRGQKKQKIEDE